MTDTLLTSAGVGRHRPQDIFAPRTARAQERDGLMATSVEVRRRVVQQDSTAAEIGGDLGVRNSDRLASSAGTAPRRESQEHSSVIGIANVSAPSTFGTSAGSGCARWIPGRSLGAGATRGREQSTSDIHHRRSRRVEGLGNENDSQFDELPASRRNSRANEAIVGPMIPATASVPFQRVSLDFSADGGSKEESDVGAVTQQQRRPAPRRPLELLLDEVPHSNSGLSPAVTGPPATGAGRSSCNFISGGKSHPQLSGWVVDEMNRLFGVQSLPTAVRSGGGGGVSNAVQRRQQPQQQQQHQRRPAVDVCHLANDRALREVRDGLPRTGEIPAAPEDEFGRAPPSPAEGEGDSIESVAMAGDGTRHSVMVSPPALCAATEETVRNVRRKGRATLDAREDDTREQLTGIDVAPEDVIENFVAHRHASYANAHSGSPRRAVTVPNAQGIAVDGHGCRRGATEENFDINRVVTMSSKSGAGEVRCRPASARLTVGGLMVEGRPHTIPTGPINEPMSERGSRAISAGGSSLVDFVQPCEQVHKYDQDNGSNRSASDVDPASARSQNEPPECLQLAATPDIDEGRDKEEGSTALPSQPPPPPPLPREEGSVGFEVERGAAKESASVRVTMAGDCSKHLRWRDEHELLGDQEQAGATDDGDMRRPAVGRRDDVGGTVAPPRSEEALLEVFLLLGSVKSIALCGCTSRLERHQL